MSEDHEERRDEIWMIERGIVLINIEERRNQIESCGLMLDQLLDVHASNLMKRVFEWCLRGFENIFNKIKQK